MRALVPDSRVIDWGFHDITIVDKEDVSAPAISDTDFSLLRQQWLTSIMESLIWMQCELDCMNTKSKLRYKSTPAASCSFCGKWIKNDMHRHVAMFHLDLGQLWRCPVSWCTVWKGTSQDYMDHLRGSHSVSSEVKTACLARFFSLWTVQREIWTDALKPCNSGISTDVLLFSEMGHVIIHHYRVFRGVSCLLSQRLSHPVAGVSYPSFCYGPLWAAQRYGTFFSSSGQFGISAEHLTARHRG